METNNEPRFRRLVIAGVITLCAMISLFYTQVVNLASDFTRGFCIGVTASCLVCFNYLLDRYNRKLFYLVNAIGVLVCAVSFLTFPCRYEPFFVHTAGLIGISVLTTLILRIFHRTTK